MSLVQAVILGVVEGVTEFLPVSSTGHLILASAWMGLQGEAVKSFEVVIQAGALGAILILYRQRVLSLARAVFRADPSGRKLLANLSLSFLPAAVAGVALHKLIKARLFSTWPVVAALALGGVAMILAERLRRPSSNRALDSITPKEAFLIGIAQCLSLWPGTSRSMVTIVAGLLIGLPPVAAAEYSFLLAIPTLGAATLFEMKEGFLFLQQAGPLSVLCGFLTSAVVAVLAVKGFIRYLTYRGLAPFGWYRVGLALVLWLIVSR